MNRKIISAVLALILCMSLAFGVSAAGNTSPVLFDEADLLSPTEEAELTARLLDVSGKYQAQIIIATVDSLEPGAVNRHIEHLYDSMGFGYGPNHDGVMLMVCMDPREYRILSNGFAGEAIEGNEIDAIGEAIVSDLSDGYYADAFDIFADRCEYYLDGYLNGFPFNFGRSLIAALVIGILAGLITALALKAQLKTVHQQHQANVYVKPGSMQLTAHSDLFLYRNVTRTKKESSKSSGGSGSSRNVGGGSF